MRTLLKMEKEEEKVEEEDEKEELDQGFERNILP